MAQSKKKNKTSFKKGQPAMEGSGRPKGALFYDREALLAKKIDNVVITNYLTLNSHLTEQQLEQRLKDPKISSLEKGMVRQLLAVSKEGSLGSLDFVLTRLVGKPKQEIELSKKDPLKDLSQDELLEMKRQLETVNRQSMNYLEQHNEKVQSQINEFDVEYRKLKKTDSD